MPFFHQVGIAVNEARSRCPVNNFSLCKMIIHFEETRWTIRHSLTLLWVKTNTTKRLSIQDPRSSIVNIFVVFILTWRSEKLCLVSVEGPGREFHSLYGRRVHHKDPECTEIALLGAPWITKTITQGSSINSLLSAKYKTVWLEVMTP